SEAVLRTATARDLKMDLHIHWMPRGVGASAFDEVMVWPATTEPLLAPGEDVDLLTMSPHVIHCDLLNDYLTADSITVAKLLYVPINPVYPPPIRSRPRPLALQMLTDLSLREKILHGKAVAGDGDKGQRDDRESE
ncbi:unnamed protein product, partial [Amoebophrya sp. A25]